MKLTLHGTGAGHPSADRSASALTASFDDGSVFLFDAGENCTRTMLRDGVDLHRIAAVAISHLHPDHWSGLPGLVQAWGVNDRVADVDIYVPAEAIDFFHSVHLYSYSFPDRQRFIMRYHELGPFELREGWSVEPFATTHLNRFRDTAVRHGLPTEAFGYVLRNGDRAIVLSQDLGSEEDLKGVIVGAELLICESSHVELHAVLAMASNAGVKHVIFTHVPPQGIEFPGRFDGVEWIVAEEGDIVEC